MSSFYGKTALLFQRENGENMRVGFSRVAQFMAISGLDFMAIFGSVYYTAYTKCQHVVETI